MRRLKFFLPESHLKLPRDFLVFEKKFLGAGMSASGNLESLVLAGEPAEPDKSHPD